MIREPRTDELEQLVDIAVEHAIDAGLAGHDDVDRHFVKKQFKNMMMSPDFKIIVEPRGDRFAAYAIGRICQKIWNGKRYGEMTFIFVHPEARSKVLADDLVSTLNHWFAEMRCDFVQTSCMTYTEDYKPNDEWLHRVRTYYKSQGMEEVGYHYVKPLEANEWVV
tara:strand:+ start:3301 stop:3795 length:495 start_codon:yes stop_codon:yes gene_type:complete